mmetsp:Transcript_113079/g.365237  ORF Transcript_113079/g.365237 Transcript_113079/m.365237 type:complete len:213 (+) Transcript_113079:249-887(+)
MERRRCCHRRAPRAPRPARTWPPSSSSGGGCTPRAPRGKPGRNAPSPSSSRTSPWPSRGTPAAECPPRRWPRWRSGRRRVRPHLSGPVAALGQSPVSKPAARAPSQKTPANSASNAATSSSRASTTHRPPQPCPLAACSANPPCGCRRSSHPKATRVRIADTMRPAMQRHTTLSMMARILLSTSNQQPQRWVANTMLGRRRWCWSRQRKRHR